MSLYVLDRNRYNRYDPLPDSNPYRRHRRVKDEDKIPTEVSSKYARKILDLILYDMEDCEALRNFEPVKNNTHCIFSKNAVLWGSQDYDTELPLGKLY